MLSWFAVIETLKSHGFFKMTLKCYGKLCELKKFMDCLASWLKYDPILINKIVQNYKNKKKITCSAFIPAFLAPYPEINSFEVTCSDITYKYIIHFKKFNFIQITYSDGISWRNSGKVLEFHLKKSVWTTNVTFLWYPSYSSIRGNKVVDGSFVAPIEHQAWSCDAHLRNSNQPYIFPLL